MPRMKATAPLIANTQIIRNNAVLACALEAKADCIVSGDAHLLRLRGFRGTQILRPLESLHPMGLGGKTS
jgi:predicted nucleic acid-binding protein